MKLLLILVDSNHRGDVERILETQGIPGYTELPNVLGKGETGRKLGNRAFPGSNTLYLSAIAGDTCETLCDELKALREKAGREEGLRVFTLDAEMVL